MLVEQMHRFGSNSDVLQALGLASAVASIATGRAARESGEVAVHEADEGLLPTG